MVTYNIQSSNGNICYKQYIGILHVLYLFAEILEAFSSLPVLAMTTGFTTTEINTVSTTGSQQLSRYTTLHHTSSVLSVKHTTASDQQHSISPSK